MIRRSFGLATDLYELTMAAAYFERGMNHRATFELFVRSLPPHRSYLITAGLDQALDYLSSLRLTPDEIEYLRSHPSFKHVSREFFDYLAEMRFSGDVWAMPEGTAAFGMEPILRIEAPLIEAQIVETYLISIITFETLIASKAARVVTAAQGRGVIDFGTRRAHGPEAGLLAARAAYIGGCIGTSNAEAGHLFGIQTLGTLAHSFIMSFDHEEEAFRAFLAAFPDSATLLVDTYDTIRAVEILCKSFAGSGLNIAAIRLDSGDLAELSKRARVMLDAAGLTETNIFASGDLNEYKISALIAGGAAIDGFGVGTELTTSYDSPALSGVYKLASEELEGRIIPRMKLSEGKATYPCAKQVWRHSSEGGVYEYDTIALAGESEPKGAHQEARPLLDAVMKAGRIMRPASNQLLMARERAREELRRLPRRLLALDCAENYPVRFSPALEKERAELSMKLRSDLDSK